MALARCNSLSLLHNIRNIYLSLCMYVLALSSFGIFLIERSQMQSDSDSIYLLGSHGNLLVLYCLRSCCYVYTSTYVLTLSPFNIYLETQFPNHVLLSFSTCVSDNHLVFPQRLEANGHCLNQDSIYKTQFTHVESTYTTKPCVDGRE